MLTLRIQIQFYGNVRKSQDANGKTVANWEGGEIVTAVAYDMPIPGYDTPSTNNLRLWSSKAASGEFDFQKFNNGEYESSVADQQRAETISAVLYPNDNLERGKELRLSSSTSGWLPRCTTSCVVSRSPSGPGARSPTRSPFSSTTHIPHLLLSNCSVSSSTRRDLSGMRLGRLSLPL